MYNYQIIGVEEKLQAAEAALASKTPTNTETNESDSKPGRENCVRKGFD